MSTKQFINVNNKYDRVVVLVDMDCFYCQVEEKLNPEIRGRPIAVVQYNPWQGGGIIAVNYPARAKGVTRHMRGDEARQHCPEIVLPQVPQRGGKADISKYRDAGKEVAAVLQTFTPLLERASIDEAYMDITERVLARLHDMNVGKFHLQPETLANTFAVGYDSVGEYVQKISCDLDGRSSSQELESEEDRVAYKKSDIKLLIGASIVNEIRAAVKEKTGYECSAGIAHNKILAKLTAGFHKPNKQTVLPLKSISKMYQTLSIKKVKGLGGKLGEQVCDLLKVEFMSQLTKFSEKQLQTHFDERMGSWIYLMARGIDLETVTPKFNSKSIGCCKRFPGKNAITGLATLQHWLGELANEIQDRLEKDLDENNRTARQMTVSYAQQFGDSDVSSTRSVPLASYEADRIAKDALEAIRRNTEVFLKQGSNGALNNPVKFLGISAGKFENNATGKKSALKEMFSNIASKAPNAAESSTDGPKVEASSSTTKQVVKKDISRFFKGREQDAAPQSSDALVKTEDISLAEETVPDAVEHCNITDKTKNAGESSTDGSKVDASCSTTKKMIKKDISSFFNAKGSENNATPQGSDVPVKTEDITMQEKSIPKDVEEDNYSNTTLPLDEVQEASPQPSPKAEPHPNDPKEDEVDSSEAPTSVPSHDDCQPSTSGLDYRSTYAEFQCPGQQQLPIPTVSVPSKPCPECGKSVPEHTLQSHMDFHVALHISQQQREEFRKEIKQKLNSPAAATAAAVPKTTKPATSQTPKAKSRKAQIDRYLTSTVQKTTNTSQDATKCEDCGKLIALEAVQEHSDFHAAKKLQLELNRMEMRTVATNGFQAKPASQTAAATGAGNKRKRPPGGDKVQPVKINNLSSYFTKM
uniref:DNA polymerase eta n=1 Tax=Culex tarsalis TaxID=7177 RepID=A0A1Q3EY70_CULTA